MMWSWRVNMTCLGSDVLRWSTANPSSSHIMSGGALSLKATVLNIEHHNYNEKICVKLMKRWWGCKSQCCYVYAASFFVVTFHVHLSKVFLCHCSTDITEAESLGISNIFRKLLLFFPPSVLVALPDEMLRQLVDNLTALTCKFAQGAANEERVCFNLLICNRTWVFLVLQKKEINEKINK